MRHRLSFMTTLIHKFQLQGTRNIQGDRKYLCENLVSVWQQFDKITHKTCFSLAFERRHRRWAQILPLLSDAKHVRSKTTINSGRFITRHQRLSKHDVFKGILIMSVEIYACCSADKLWNWSHIFRFLKPDQFGFAVNITTYEYGLCSREIPNGEVVIFYANTEYSKWNS